jgi:hypothetical protein
VHLHGVPQSIESDRHPLFISLFWTELFRLQCTTLNMGSVYHPETDGQAEVVNRCLEVYLRCFASEQPKEWYYWVDWQNCGTIPLFMYPQALHHLRQCTVENLLSYLGSIFTR